MKETYNSYLRAKDVRLSAIYANAWTVKVEPQSPAVGQNAKITYERQNGDFDPAPFLVVRDLKNNKEVNRIPIVPNFSGGVFQGDSDTSFPSAG